MQSSSSELSFESPITVPPYTEVITNFKYLTVLLISNNKNLQYSLVVKYSPLLLGVTEAHVEVSTKELGNYPYDFVLTAHPPIPEPYVYFSGSLGQVVSQKAILFNESTFHAEFICQVSIRLLVKNLTHKYGFISSRWSTLVYFI